jgi:hypothetical protein
MIAIDTAREEDVDIHLTAGTMTTTQRLKQKRIIRRPGLPLHRDEATTPRMIVVKNQKVMEVHGGLHPHHHRHLTPMMKKLMIGNWYFIAKYWSFGLRLFCCKHVYMKIEAFTLYDCVCDFKLP